MLFRVGNMSFRNELLIIKNLVHYRISNDRDIVTAAPMIDYHHTGVNISLTDKIHGNILNYDQVRMVEIFIIQLLES